MLEGRGVRLRTVRESDLDALYEAHCDIRNRGPYFPLGVHSEPDFRRDFAEHGFWQKSEGMLLITALDGEVAGHIEFFRPVGYWDAFELSYQLYDDRHAGQGYVTEAVQLLVDYLFWAKKEHRIQLVIVPENAASRRIADKCGFTLEGDGPGRLLQPGPQPGRPALLTAQHRPSALAGNHNVRVTVRYSAQLRGRCERKARESGVSARWCCRPRRRSCPSPRPRRRRR